MTRLQLGVLYRQFLFRLVDLEVLSPEGDVKQLLGQFAALLIWISSFLALGGLILDRRHMRPDGFAAAAWGGAHFFIATTMLVVGFFAVLSWDSALPDRRDVMVLAPLPVRARTMFLAKIAALGAALGLTVAALNGPASLTWPAFVLAAPDSGFSGAIRSFVAYWIAVAAAGAFVFCRAWRRNFPAATSSACHLFCSWARSSCSSAGISWSHRSRRRAPWPPLATRTRWPAGRATGFLDCTSN